ncbi:MAG: 50S ribosomal protein P1 [Thermoprotei archaeon]
MEYIYASLLLHSAKKEINEENLKNVLQAAGANIDEVRIKAVVSALKEVNIDEAIKAAAPVYAAPAAASAAPAAAETGAKEEKKAEKKEEKKEEVSEEAMAQGLEALFG